MPLRGGNYYSLGATQQDYTGTSNDFGNASMQIMSSMSLTLVWCTLMHLSFW